MDTSAFSSDTGSIGLALRGVTVRYAQNDAIQNIGLEIPRGGFVSIVGPSGCGKSTLLRCIAGLELPTEGTVLLGSQAMTSEAHAPSEQIGFVFQRPNLLPWRNVLDNIGLPLELTGVPRPEREASARAARSSVGLDDIDDKKLPKMLSGGMQMRVSVARAMVTKPTIMLMDEPFAAVDDLLRARLNDEILTLWQQQRWTTVLVTHQIHEAVFLSQRVVVMSPSPGRILSTVEVPLPYPRSLSDRGRHEFQMAVQAIHTTLQRFDSL